MSVFQAVLVDVKSRSVTFEDGLKMDYRKLFIATGSRLARSRRCAPPLWATQQTQARVRLSRERPKAMSYKGKEVRNVFHLRTPEDANSIAKLSNNRNAVIVGTSFVGEEQLNTHRTRLQPQLITAASRRDGGGRSADR